MWLKYHPPNLGQLVWTRRKGATWNCGCIFTEEHADVGASRYGVVSAERYPARHSPTDCKILYHFLCLGSGGSRVVYQVNSLWK